jgi:hypothetical protein
MSNGETNLSSFLIGNQTSDYFRMGTLKGRLNNSQKWAYVNLLFGHLWCRSQELARLSLLAFTELVMYFCSSSFSIVISNVTSINISIVNINTPCTKMIDADWKLIIFINMLYRITNLIDMKDNSTSL